MKISKLKSIIVGLIAMSAITILITSCEQESIILPDEVQDNADSGILSRHGHIGGLGVFDPITAQEAASLRVYIDPCFVGTVYEDAIPAALQEFQASATIFRFTIIPFPNYAHLTFSCDDGNVCGQGLGSPPLPPTATFFPSGGAIGNEITLMTTWNSCPCTPEELDQCYFERTVLHEIFHSLGFVHNDEQEFFTHAEGTPTDDYIPGSVINSGQSEYNSGNLCNPTCVLSEWDLIALRDLYPCPAPTASDITYNQSGSQIANLIATPYAGILHQFRYRPKSAFVWWQLPWQTLPSTTGASSPFNQYCNTQYDVQLRVRCGNSWGPGWSSTKVVGCIQ